MSAPPAALASCHSPVDLMRLAGVEPMSTAHETILDALYAARPTAGQAREWRALSSMPWPARRHRRAALAMGRRAGKTSVDIAWACAFELLCVPHELHAGAGSRVYFVVVAPFVAQARESVRGIRAALDACARLGVRYEARDLGGAPELVITAPASRVEKVVRVMTADAVAVRGFAIPWVAFDEAAFLPSAEWHAQTDRDLVRAITPGQATFPEARQLYVSSPGAPQGVFHALVTKPPRDVLVVRASTWQCNPRVSEAACRELAGDLATFEQEYRAARFGYAGESFIDASRIVIGSPYAGLGPRPGAFVVGLDVAQLRDQTAIVVCSSFGVDVSHGHAPVRHVVVERAEAIASDRKAPTPLEAIAARVVELSRAFGSAPVLFDAFSAPNVKRELAKLGMREHVDPSGCGVPPPGTFCQRSMAPQHQTPRWKLVADVAHGGRLHMGADDEPLARQLAQLHATQLSSGALKVEGRRDDLADALALACEVAVKLAPTGGPHGHVEYRYEGVQFTPHEGLKVRGGRWVRALPAGGEVPAEMPEWAPGFDDHARDMVAQGVFTDSIRRWLDRQPEEVRREIAPGHATAGINVPVR